MEDIAKKPEYDYSKFYTDQLDLSPSTREVLVNYSKIPSEQVEDHIRNIRARAWKIHPYPCIGMFRFLHLAIGQHKLYKDEILPRMLSGKQNYLDLGCAFAQDIRRLVADGVSSEHCYGVDLRLDFLELGYELFNDRATLRSKFIEADIFDQDSPIKDLYGKMDIIDASSFFHLFSLHDQKAVARSVIKLMSPQANSLLVGRQVGTEDPGEHPRRSGTATAFRHNIASWREMWQEIGREFGVEFQVDGKLEPVHLSRAGNAVDMEGRMGMMMEFSVRRLG